jgi:hypothetical protein
MSASLTPRPTGPTFICASPEYARSACKGESLFKEHEGKQYCVLHFPDNEKSADFKQALQKKLSNEDFDFRGVWFPDQLGIPNNFEFEKDADFSSTTFHGVADFRGVIFRGAAQFDDASFGPLVLFNSAHFAGTSHFHGASFVGYANFSSVTFDEQASFLAGEFSSGASFHHSAFNKGADFTGVKVAGLAYFRSVKFFKDVEFKHAKFNSADFKYSSFGGNAGFENSVFGSDVDFFSTTFGASVNFSSAAFIGTSNFRKSSFSASASFDRSTFSGGAYFSSASFNGDALFSAVTFSSAASFGRTSFATKADFSYAHFNGRAGFAGDDQQQVFGDESAFDFQYSTVEKPGDLAFHTVTLRPHWFVNVDARRFEFINVKWHSRSVGLEIKNLIDRRIESPHSLLAIACRHLAVNAEENHRYKEASEFRYMAMDAGRQEHWRGFAFGRLSWLYWFASGYGERAFRALIVLRGLLALFAALYTKVGFARWEPKLATETDAVSTKRDDLGAPLPFKRAIMYAGEVLTFQKPEPRPATHTARGAVFLETILGPVQAALLALAIRRKFMR